MVGFHLQLIKYGIKISSIMTRMLLNDSIPSGWIGKLAHSTASYMSYDNKNTLTNVNELLWVSPNFFESSTAPARRSAKTSGPSLRGTLTNLKLNEIEDVRCEGRDGFESYEDICIYIYTHYIYIYYINILPWHLNICINWTYKELRALFLETP